MKKKMSETGNLVCSFAVTPAMPSTNFKIKKSSDTVLNTDLTRKDFARRSSTSIQLLRKTEYSDLCWLC
jgi:hypothetical protein